MVVCPYHEVSHKGKLFMRVLALAWEEVSKIGTQGITMPLEVK